MAWRMGELLVTPQAWLLGRASACVIAGSAGGVATAWISSRGTAAHATETPGEPGVSGAAWRPLSMPARLVAVALAATAAAWVLAHSTPTVDDFRFRRDAELAAHAMRASSLQVQSASIGDLLDAAPKEASIVEHAAGTEVIVKRAIRDREQLAAELAALKARGGAIVHTRYKDFAIAGDLTQGLHMVFEDALAAGAATETFGYEWRHGKLVLTMYNYGFSGPRDNQRDSPAWQALLISR